MNLTATDGGDSHSREKTLRYISRPNRSHDNNAQCGQQPHKESERFHHNRTGCGRGPAAMPLDGARRAPIHPRSWWLVTGAGLWPLEPEQSQCVGIESGPPTDKDWHSLFIPEFHQEVRLHNRIYRFYQRLRNLLFYFIISFNMSEVWVAVCLLA